MFITIDWFDLVVLVLLGGFLLVGVVLVVLDSTFKWLTGYHRRAK